MDAAFTLVPAVLVSLMLETMAYGECTRGPVATLFHAVILGIFVVLFIRSLSVLKVHDI